MAKRARARRSAAGVKAGKERDQRLCERVEREPHVLPARAREHRRAVFVECQRSLDDEPGLPTPGLCAHEHGLSQAGRDALPRLLERLELAATTDVRRLRHTVSPTAADRSAGGISFALPERQGDPSPLVDSRFH